MSPAPVAGSSYPREYETDVALRDGSTVHVRPVRAEDAPAIRSFLEAISPDSIGFRFFGAPNLDWVVSWSINVDYADRFALIAETGTPSRIIAHAAYIRTDPERAEVAFLVADAWQGHGISTIMLAHLAGAAAHQGIVTFTADVLPANHRMISVFRDSGFPVDMQSTRDAIEIEIPTSLSPAALARFEERDAIAAIAAVRSFLAPRSVAVVGASRRRGTIGGEILHNLVAGGYAGVVYPVNDRADVVQSLPAHRSVSEISDPVELAVVVVPAEQVVAVARECAGAGIRALLVISAGFAETGEDGAQRQRELVGVCRGSGMRLVGPNCLGVLNTAPEVSLNATFAPRPPLAGRVAFLSQGGGVGIAMMGAAERLGIGLSSVVSVGNNADLSSNDLLRYWQQDSDTDLALLDLVSFGSPRTFARVARAFARRKPILAVKSGRSAAGGRATSSHTSALLAASEVTADALFHQAGVICTETLHELFDVATLLTNQPIPGGDRVAIVTNGGGPGIVCADACRAHGMLLAEPFDMTPSATAEDYRQTLRTVIDGEAYDAIIVIFVPARVTQAADVAAAIIEVAQAAQHCTIASVFMTGEGPPPRLRSSRVKVPGYEFPEDAARALGLAARHGRWRARPEGRVVSPPGFRSDEAAAIISAALADGSSWLAPARVAALLDCFGLPLAASQVVGDATLAVAAAAQLGGPVALKAVASGLLHKTDAGGVRLNLDGSEAVRTAAREIQTAVARAGLELDGLLVQSMAPSGVELIVGVVPDHTFGPVLACGAGGPSAELIMDLAVRITPVTDSDVREMVRSLKTFPLLNGYRGAPRCDVEAIEDVLLRVSAMVDTHPEIVELDFDPLVVGPDGALIVDARLRVAASEASSPVPSLTA